MAALFSLQARLACFAKFLRPLDVDGAAVPLRRLIVARRVARCTTVCSFLVRMEEEGQQVVMENLEAINVSPRECIPERIEEQTVELAESSGEAGVTKSVGAAQPPGFAKKMDDVSVPTEESLEVVRITPKERIPERTLVQAEWKFRGDRDHAAGVRLGAKIRTCRRCANAASGGNCRSDPARSARTDFRAHCRTGRGGHENQGFNSVPTQPP